MIRVFPFLFSILCYVSSAYGVLDQEKFFMTHVTPHFPKQGVMIPGVTRPEDGSLPAKNSMPNPRVTLHWIPFGVHEPHAGNANTGVKYLIIERGSKPLSRIVGGEAEDFYMVDPHYLSKDSVIIVPSDEIDQLKSDNPHLRAQLESYDPKKETVVSAGKRIIAAHGFNSQGVIYNSAKVISEILTLQDSNLLNVIIELRKDPSQGTLHKLESGAFRLDRRPFPEEQELLVNGVATNAKDFFAYSGRFAWHGHEGTVYAKFEQAVTNLFAPVLSQANFLKGGFDSKPYEDSLVLWQLIADFNREFDGIKQELNSLVSSENQSFIQEYLLTLFSSMDLWFELINLQTAKDSPYYGKPFAETPYGNSEILEREIKTLQAKMFTFDPLEILAQHFPLNKN